LSVDENDDTGEARFGRQHGDGFTDGDLRKRGRGIGKSGRSRGDEKESGKRSRARGREKKLGGERLREEGRETKRRAHPSSQHIVNDHDPSLERSSNHVSTLSVILLLLSVVAEILIDVVSFAESHGGDRGERDSLVGRTEEDVEVGSDGRGEESGSVGLGGVGEEGAGVEETSVEEVRGETEERKERRREERSASTFFSFPSLFFAPFHPSKLAG